MANGVKDFLVPVDLNKNELREAVVQVLASAPSNPSAGQIYFDSTLTAFRYWDGSEWITLRRLDQLKPPTTAVPFNAQRATGLADPTDAQDAATKAYVDALSAGRDWKDSVRVATTGNINLASAPASIDGVSLNLNDRVLARAQTTASENGIYVWNSAGNAMTRATDADSSGDLGPGATVPVEEGTTYGDTRHVLTTNAPITLGTTALTFTQDAGETLQAGAGLTKTGTTFDVGAGTGISVAADSVAVDTAVVVRKFAADVGDGAATSYNIDHNLNTRDVTVQVYTNASPYDTVEVDVERTSVNRVVLRFASAPASNAYRVVVHA